MKIAAQIFSVLFFVAPMLGVTPVQAGGKAPDVWYAELAAGVEPKTVAAKFPVESLTDLQALNALRLRLKADGKEAVAQSFFADLSGRKPTDAVLLNFALACVDQMAGKSLLRQGDLSTRSQRAVEQIIERNPGLWAAWYIRGINNLYWPDWFRKAPLAVEYLTAAVAIHERLPAAEQDENDMYAMSYLALGDAYALLDQSADARRIWKKGRSAYPYAAVLRERLSLADGDQHTSPTRI